MDIELILRDVNSRRPSSLSPNQKRYLTDLYRSLDKKIFLGHKLSEIIPIMGKVLNDKLNEKIRDPYEKKSNQSTDVDLHEYQVKTISEGDLPSVSTDVTVLDSTNSTSIVGTDISASIDPSFVDTSIDKFLGINDLTELKLLFNPESMYVHYYLVLDSDYRDTTQEISSNITKFKWAYTPTQNTTVTGFCNSVGVIRDIIGMRMYQPRVPFVSAMNSNSKRVSVLIEEFQAQAFICETGRRFHFILRPIFVSGQTSIELSTEDYNDGIFNFRKPITTFDTMTISLGDPINVLSFATPFDRFMIAIEFVCLKSDK